MKKILTLILLLFVCAKSQAQAVKKIDYTDLVIQTLPALSAGDVLLVEKIDNTTLADALLISYNGGNNINGTKSATGATFSKKFTIPADATKLKIVYGTGTNDAYDKSLTGGAAPPPVVIPSIPDNDQLNTAIWAAITMDAYLYQLRNTPAAIKKEELQKILARFIDPARLTSVYGGDYGNWKTTNPFVSGLDYTKLFPAPDAAALNGGIADIVGGMDVTKYVQAFADFLRDRIKQELTIAYLQKLKQTLEDNKEIRELLPKTWATFKDNDIFNLPSMGTTYKDAFAADLASLPDNFIAYEKRHHFAGMSPGNQEAFTIGSAMYTFINQMATGDHPSTALHSVALQNPYSAASPLTSTYVIAVTDMLSQNLRVKDGYRWIELRTVEKLNPDIIRIFFALLSDKYPELFSASHLSRTLSSLAGNTDVQQRFNDIYNFVVLAQNVDKRIKEYQDLKDKAGNTTAAERKQLALDFFLSNSDVLTDLVKTTFSVVDPDDVHKEAHAMTISGLTDAIDIAKAVRSNNFARATNATISLITTVAGSEQNKKWITPLKSILIFANDVVAAKTSDEIKAVIENYAAPVQSYQVIRKSTFSVALSAYPGLYVGSEWSSQTNTQLFKYGTYGVTAPIGFAFSTGRADRDSWSKTIYLSVFDIGAALSYRFSNSSTDIPDKITLAQIFSPGLHLVWGIKKSPLAIKVGYQYAPQLRSITTQANTTGQAGVWRLSAGLCVDLPIYIFSSKH